MADVDPPEPGAWSARQIRARPRWRQVRAKIEDEQLIRPWRGAYCTPDAPLVTRLAALELAVGVPLVACDRTAAALHGFGVCDDGQLHVTALDGRSLRRRTGVRVHQWVPRSQTIVADGFLATAPADTAIDVAASGREIDILPVLDAALAVGVPDTDLDEAVVRAKGRRGMTAVRGWSSMADGRAQSPMESRTRYRLICGGLPPPELQIRVELPGQTRFLDAGGNRSNSRWSTTGRNSTPATGSWPGTAAGTISWSPPDGRSPTRRRLTFGATTNGSCSTCGACTPSSAQARHPTKS